MPTIAKKPQPKNELIYETCGDFVLVETSRKFGIIRKEVFEKCNLDYAKILKAMNESRIFCATDQFLEYYSKYGFSQIYEGYNYWDARSNYLRFDADPRDMPKYVVEIKEVLKKYKKGFPSFFYKDGNSLVDVLSNKELKRPVIITDFYDDYFSELSYFAIQSDDMIPLYTDPESCDEWHGSCKHEYLEGHECEDANLEAIVYYPTDEEWNDYLKSKKEEEDFFYNIVNDKFEKWLENNNTETIDKQAKENLEDIESILVRSLKKYNPQVENNKIILSMKPRNIIINISEKL